MSGGGLANMGNPAALYPIRLERASFADNPKEATVSIESRDSARVGSATHKALNRVTSGLIYLCNFLNKFLPSFLPINYTQKKSIFILHDSCV